MPVDHSKAEIYGASSQAKAIPEAGRCRNIRNKGTPKSCGCPLMLPSFKKKKNDLRSLKKKQKQQKTHFLSGWPNKMSTTKLVQAQNVTKVQQIAGCDAMKSAQAVPRKAALNGREAVAMDPFAPIRNTKQATQAVRTQAPCPSIFKLPLKIGYCRKMMGKVPQTTLTNWLLPHNCGVNSTYASGPGTHIHLHPSHPSGLHFRQPAPQPEAVRGPRICSLRLSMAFF